MKKIWYLPTLGLAVANLLLGLENHRLRTVVHNSYESLNQVESQFLTCSNLVTQAMDLVTKQGLIIKNADKRLKFHEAVCFYYGVSVCKIYPDWSPQQFADYYSKSTGNTNFDGVAK